MFLVIIDHYCVPTLKEEAVERIARNGNLMAGADGFLFRYTAEDISNPLAISTITAWRDAECHRNWLAIKPGERNDGSPYERFTSRSFDVLDRKMPQMDLLAGEWP